jgi:hypothetical protein
MAAAKYHIAFRMEESLPGGVSRILGLDPPLTESDWRHLTRRLLKPGADKERPTPYQQAFQILKLMRYNRSMAEAARLRGVPLARTRVCVNQFLDQIAYTVRWERENVGLDYRREVTRKIGRWKRHDPVER